MYALEEAFVIFHFMVWLKWESFFHKLYCVRIKFSFW